MAASLLFQPISFRFPGRAGRGGIGLLGAHQEDIALLDDPILPWGFECRWGGGAE